MSEEEDNACLLVNPTDDNIVFRDIKEQEYVDEESIIGKLLKLACDTSELDGKTLLEKIDTILAIRVKNELMLSQLLHVETKHDKIDVGEAAKINNKSKDSLSDLIKVKQLLEGLPTERISVDEEENQFRMARLTKMRGKGDTDDS